MDENMYLCTKVGWCERYVLGTRERYTLQSNPVSFSVCVCVRILTKRYPSLSHQRNLSFPNILSALNDSELSRP